MGAVPTAGVVGTVLVMVALVAAAIPVASAGNSEQVVYSGLAPGTFGGSQGGVAFWVWCEADSENPYAGLCTGALQFPALGIVEAVKGGITENPDHVYHQTVASSDGRVLCTLTNTLPIVHGPANTVDVWCSMPAGSGESTNAVVVVTGPG